MLYFVLFFSILNSGTVDKIMEYVRDYKFKTNLKDDEIVDKGGSILYNIVKSFTVYILQEIAQENKPINYISFQNIEFPNGTTIVANCTVSTNRKPLKKSSIELPKCFNSCKKDSKIQAIYLVEIKDDNLIIGADAGSITVEVPLSFLEDLLEQVFEELNKFEF